MRPLFWRILALMLASFAITTIGGLALYISLSQDRDPDERYIHKHSLEVAQKLVAAAESGRLEQARRELRHRLDMRVWIVTDDGKTLGRRPVPRELLTMIDAYPAIVRPMKNPLDRSFVYAHRIERSNGAGNYRVILSSPLPPHRLNPHARGIAVPIAIFILAILAASALMSWWILRPLRAFSETAKNLSPGNLAERIPDDITRRKDAFGALGRDFNTMASRVEDAVKNQKRLLRDVSHELRTPLTRILMASALDAKKTGSTEELERIEQEVKKLDLLIEDLLTLSRSEHPDSLVRGPVPLAAMVDGIIGDVNFEYQDAGRVARQDIDPGLIIHADERLLRTALENLIRNAMRHTRGGTEVAITAEVTSTGTNIRVSDHGPGVPEEALSRIFEPFYRQDPSRTDTGGQHGIGLTLAKSIVSAHGGTVGARNREQGGLIVEISLPRPPRDGSG